MPEVRQDVQPSGVVVEETPRVDAVLHFTAPEIQMWKMTELAKDLELENQQLNTLVDEFRKRDELREQETSCSHT